MRTRIWNQKFGFVSAGKFKDDWLKFFSRADEANVVLKYVKKIDNFYYVKALIIVWSVVLSDKNISTSISMLSSIELRHMTQISILFKACKINAWLEFVSPCNISRQITTVPINKHLRLSDIVCHGYLWRFSWIFLV